jgi:hypothetical protein
MTEANHLEAALAQLIQERAELDSVIAALQKRLGKPAEAGGQNRGQSTVSAESLVYRGAYFGLAVTKAAEKLLKAYGRPLKTPEFVAAFKSAEYDKVKGDNARAIVYTALLRSRDFVKVLPDTWDLAERHPQAAEKKLQELAAKAKGKTKSKGKGKPIAKAKAEIKPVETAVGGLKVA